MVHAQRNHDLRTEAMCVSACRRVAEGTAPDRSALRHLTDVLSRLPTASDSCTYDRRLVVATDISASAIAWKL